MFLVRKNVFFLKNIWLVRKNVLSLQCQKDNINMKKLLLTDKEADLIEMIRNYGKSYPNGYPQIKWEIDRIYNELLDEAENAD